MARKRGGGRKGGGKRGGGKRGGGGGKRGGNRSTAVTRAQTRASSGGGKRSSGGGGRSSGGGRATTPRASGGGSRKPSSVRHQDTKPNAPKPAPGATKTLGRNRQEARIDRRKNMSVKDRRAAAKEAGMSMSDFKAGVRRGTNRGSGSRADGNMTSQVMPSGSGQALTPSGAKLTSNPAFNLADYKDSHYAQYNPNIDKYQMGQERMSSEGLYQDRYNVGYHGEDDAGDPYASNSFMGSTSGYFDNFRKGKDSFMHAYQQYVGMERDRGYAGDVLKMADQGKLNLTDDQYNMVVTDARNYDWDKRNEIAGRDAHQASYDSRVGGMSQASINANKEWEENQRNLTQGGFANDYDQNASTQYQNVQNQQQNMMDYDFSQFMPSQRQGNKFQSYGGYTGPSSFGAGMQFSFDPRKFMQGQ